MMHACPSREPSWINLFIQRKVTSTQVSKCHSPARVAPTARTPEVRERPTSVRHRMQFEAWRFLRRYVDTAARKRVGFRASGRGDARYQRSLAVSVDVCQDNLQPVSSAGGSLRQMGGLKARPGIGTG